MSISFTIDSKGILSFQLNRGLEKKYRKWCFVKNDFVDETAFSSVEEVLQCLSLPIKPMPIVPHWLTDDMAWLLGYLFINGNFESTPFFMTCHERLKIYSCKLFSNKVCSILKQIGAKPVVIESKSSGLVVLQCENSDLIWVLRTILTCHDHKWVPAFMLNTFPEVVHVFLQGVHDSLGILEKKGIARVQCVNNFMFFGLAYLVSLVANYELTAQTDLSQLLVVYRF